MPVSLYRAYLLTFLCFSYYGRNHLQYPQKYQRPPITFLYQRSFKSKSTSLNSNFQHIFEPINKKYQQKEQIPRKVIKLIHITSHLVNFIMALTESSLVSLRALMASVLVHLVYSMTILMLSADRPSSETSSPDTSWACSLPTCWAACWAPSGLTGLWNWLTSDCPADPPKPSMLGFPKMMQAFSDPGDFHTSGSSMLMTKALPFLMVTLLIPVTGFNPILDMAFLNFFSPLFDPWASSPS